MLHMSMADPEPSAVASIRVRRRGLDVWPERHAFANALEENSTIRQLFRTNKNQLLCWPSPQLVGVASLKALAMNVDVVKIALGVWGEVMDYPKSMQVDWLKQEAWHTLYKLCMFA